MEADILGDHGEILFKQWANLAGFSVNRSEQDVTGWDFILEPKKLQKNERAFDTNPENSAIHYTIGVQVKTSQSGTKDWYIAIEHMRRKISEKRPEFFCFILVDPDDYTTIDAVYIIQVWEEQIEDTFRKIRKLKKENQSEKGKSILVKSSDGYKLSHPYDISLLNALNQNIGDIDKYVTEKENLKSTLGYQDGIVTMNATGTVKTDVLEEFFLGYKQRLELENIKMTDNRFGIELAEQLEKGAIEHTDTPENKTKVIFGKIGSSNSFEMVMDLYGTQKKTRLANNLFEIIIDDSDICVMKMSFNIINTTVEALYHLVLVYKILNANPILTIINNNNPLSIPCESGIFNQDLINEFDFISKSFEIAKKANCLDIDFDMNIVIQQKENINQVYDFFVLEKYPTTFLFEKNELDSSDNCLVPMPFVLQFSRDDLLIIFFVLLINKEKNNPIYNNTELYPLWVFKDDIQLFSATFLKVSEYQQYMKTSKSLIEEKYPSYNIVIQDKLK